MDDNPDGSPEPEYQQSGLVGYKTFKHKESFQTSFGAQVPLNIAYETWGTLSNNKDNAILLQTGMSASSHAKSHEDNPSPGWWEQFIGPGLALDTNLFYIICTNNLGGCYGSTGPSTIDEATGKPYGSTFPMFSIQDQVRAQFLLLDELGIDKLHAAVGSSLGGMQSLCAAAEYPERVTKMVTMSACAKSYPGSMAFRACQRKAVMGDPAWNGGHYYDGELPSNGLTLARMIGTITYRSGPEWSARFGQTKITPEGEMGLGVDYMIESYLHHQGEKWVSQYDPNSMLYISKAMDAFTMEKPDENGRLCLEAGLAPAKSIPSLVIGVQTDVLFPIWQQKEIADTLKAIGNPHVSYYELDALFGHDTFLLDIKTISAAVKGHLEQEPFGTKGIWEDLQSTAAKVVARLAARDTSLTALREVFKTLDSDDSGLVPEKQLKDMITMLWGEQLSAAQINGIFAEINKSGNKSMHLEQWLQVRKKVLKATGDEDIDFYTVI